MTTEQAVQQTILSPEKQENNKDAFEAHKFKPGQSGNPKGRPKSILSKKERLQLLSEMARTNKHKANPVEAIREQNRMEGVYPTSTLLQDNRQTINIIDVQGKILQLLEHRAKEIPQDIVEGEVATKQE